MNLKVKVALKLKLIIPIGLIFFISSCTQYGDQINHSVQGERIGVLVVSHGGFETFGEKETWESTMQIFSYDQNSPVYKQIIWNPEYWPQILKAGNAPKELGKYSFEFKRIGGVDPYPESKRILTEQLALSLQNKEKSMGVDFIVDKMTWISPDIYELVNPRNLYHSKIGNDVRLNYCGAGDPSWHDCEVDRYDIDGPVERLLKLDVDRIIMIDLTTAGARFSKTFDVYIEAKKIIEKFNTTNKASISLEWVNDPNELMLKSFPTEPKNWTRSLGEPISNPMVDYKKNPNPVISDTRLADFHIKGIELELSSEVSIMNTGVLMINHGILSFNEVFDPKINDTLILNKNIKKQLLKKYPEMRSENILGGWFGDMVNNEKIKVGGSTFSSIERSREMRGENLGYNILYDSDNERPEGDWGYRYWEALDQLRKNGVDHIVIVFPQIMENSVLNLVEVPNQIAKEIGYMNWIKINVLDFKTYPQIGHPFADYWGVWVNPDCKSMQDPTVTVACCFEMGGCNNDQPYPPMRQTALDKKRNDLDPSLAFDVSHYGHLGYDPSIGSPSQTEPTQSQYNGTWSMWRVEEDHQLVAEFLADKVIQHIESR